jgi:hypothetical protein
MISIQYKSLTEKVCLFTWAGAVHVGDVHGSCRVPGTAELTLGSAETQTTQFLELAIWLVLKELHRLAIFLHIC